MFRKAMLRKAVTQIDVRDHPIPNSLTNIVATWEARQRDAADRLLTATGVTDEFGGLDPEDRQDELLGMTEALQEGRLGAWWIEQHDRLDNPEDAEALIGLDPDEWRDQIEAWARSWRRAEPDAVDGKTDAQIADLHVRHKFGVPLGEFSKNVVEFSKGDALETVLTGHLRATTEAMNRAADAIEEGQE